MARRRMTIKRLDPWSVLKFGAFANVVLYAVFLLVAGVVWFIIDRLQLVDQACDIALDVGFTSCGVNAGNLFQVLALLGGMWVIVQTAVLVFLSFLHNLIADLTGGLVIGVVDDSVSAPSTSSRNAAAISAGSAPRGRTGSTASGRVDGSANSGRTRTSGGSEAEVRRGDEPRPPATGGEVTSTKAQSRARPGPTTGDDALFEEDR